MDAEPTASLSFPDGPKLELDQLIDQLVERARDVQQVQGRLRGLLRATEVVTGELGLDAVLRHIAQAACSLAGARYAALGVIAPDGSLEQFIHVGIDDDLLERIGHLPEGKGLLGALITDPRPIRLGHIADDPRSSGFPPGHPPMGSFLGVPVLVHGEVYGNLYLTESTRGDFTEDDEALVRSLAVTAGTAISNARLYSESRSQQRWLAASAEISAQLLSSSGEDPLRMIARRSGEIAEADLVSVAILAPGGDEVMIEVAIGDAADELLGRTFRVSETLSGKAIEDGLPMMLHSPADSPGRHSHLDSVFPTGPMMVIPLIGTNTTLGVLTIARRIGRSAFSAADLAMATAFAGQASVALELTAARSDQQRMLLLEDRDRIARDLHDHVIQQLFAIGLSLEGIAVAVGPESPAGRKLGDRVVDLDRTIRQIRTSIFELRGPLGGGPTGLRSRIGQIAAEVTPALGFAPVLDYRGAVDLAVPDQLADDVAACVREGLTNTAKHAQATTAEVVVAVTADELTVLITDDGVGITGSSDLSGIANLRTRAERRGGTFEVATGPAGGTTVIWKVPLR